MENEIKFLLQFFVSIDTVAYVWFCCVLMLLFELQLISFLNDFLFKTFDYAILINYNNCYAKFSKEKKYIVCFGFFYIQTRTFQRINISTICFVLFYCEMHKICIR